MPRTACLLTALALNTFALPALSASEGEIYVSCGEAYYVAGALENTNRQAKNWGLARGNQLANLALYKFGVKTKGSQKKATARIKATYGDTAATKALLKEVKSCNAHFGEAAEKSNWWTFHR